MTRLRRVVLWISLFFLLLFGVMLIWVASHIHWSKDHAPAARYVIPESELSSVRRAADAGDISAQRRIALHYSIGLNHRHAEVPYIGRE
jgi:hypothetical protein